MKKLLLFSVCLLVTSISAFCQFPEPDWGSFKLDGREVFGVMFNYTKATIDGYSYKDYISEYEDFTEEVSEAEKRFIDALNELFAESSNQALSYLRFSSNIQDRKHILLVTFLYIKHNGDCSAKLYIVGANGQEAEINKLYGHGGRWGSFINLMGDGMESLAGEIYYQFKNAVRARRI